LLGPQRDAQTERRLTALIDGRRIDLVIDRMFRAADGQYWIVDYKTSSHQGADVEGFLDREQERYQAQLARYAQALGEHQGVNVGLYFPLLGGWREWRAL
jgi:ATP-dependent exoDNAse (exonuclease V) beta subunit